jgi:hypothetical protein
LGKIILNTYNSLSETIDAIYTEGMEFWEIIKEALETGLIQIKVVGTGGLHTYNVLDVGKKGIVAFKKINNEVNADEDRLRVIVWENILSSVPTDVYSSLYGLGWEPKKRFHTSIVVQSAKNPKDTKIRMAQAIDFINGNL